ncbi:endonuclease/exonuclease/phosphatase family protein [Robertkochia marina]|nr:endonuclease/exonuclease/phosphatase family protein [Robertkochia marina]
MTVSAQESTPSFRMMAFYNVENLFLPNNEEASPDTYVFNRSSWDEVKYQNKIDAIARVIVSLGNEWGLTGPDILGVAEVENIKVLNDLKLQSLLSGQTYDVVHFDSPDHRGIDVALLYKRASFIPVRSQRRPLILRLPEGQIIRSRDVLVVTGYFGPDLIHILVNHWPSRRGGSERSDYLRREAAQLNRVIIDSISRLYSNPFIITMGDFNDDPTSNSIYNILGGREAGFITPYHNLINPMLPLFRKGFGSLAYRDNWHLFDQILMSRPAFSEVQATYTFHQAGIYMPSWLKTDQGRYKGYPFRTYIGNSYQGGYSDHFPVYLIFKSKESLGKPDIIRNPE